VRLGEILVADTVSGFKKSEQNSGRKIPKFQQELSKSGAQECKVTILWAQKLSSGAFWPTLTVVYVTTLIAYNEQSKTTHRH